MSQFDFDQPCWKALTEASCAIKESGEAAFAENSDNHIELLLRWDRLDGVVADFLSRISPIFRKPGDFGDPRLNSDRPAPPADAKNVHKSLWINSLYRLYLVSIAAWEPKAKSPPDTILMNVPEAGKLLSWQGTPSES